jgi:hypothetical protein
MYNFKKLLILSGFLSCALYANDINIDGLIVELILFILEVI